MSEETKNTTEVKKEATKEVAKDTATTTIKNTTWANRLWSAVVGIAVGVASMFGVTNSQIAQEKAKVTSIKTQVTAALEALKAGDVTVATANLNAAIATGKEVVADAKIIAEQVKAADKQSVIETAKNEIAKTVVANQVKKVETATAAYSADTKTIKSPEEKKTETAVKK